MNMLVRFSAEIILHLFNLISWFLVPGSDLEKTDLKKAYNNGKGCINYIMEHVPFMGVEDEERFDEIIREWIEKDEVPEFKAFTNEPKAKRDRRHKKYARESKEAEKIKEKMQQQNGQNDLSMQIMKRGQERASNFGSFLDKLLDKYGDEDDDFAIDVKDIGKRTQKNSKKTGKERKETPIKSGRVSKRNK